jgi:hypothetical protein
MIADQKVKLVPPQMLASGYPNPDKEADQDPRQRIRTVIKNLPPKSLHAYSPTSLPENVKAILSFPVNLFSPRQQFA